MSLGDYVRYLRALKGGPSPLEMAEEGDIPSGEYRQIEQRYREVATDETVQKLARYFGVPVEELEWRRAWSRKRLTGDLDRAMRQGLRIHLHLRTGEHISGTVEWYDLGAALIIPDDGSGELVLQRHIVETWKVEEAAGHEAPPPVRA